MFPSSALQKPNREHSFFLTGQDTDLEMRRFLFKHTDPLSLARSRCMSLAAPPSNQLSPQECCSGKGLPLCSPGYDFFHAAFTFRAKLPHKAPAGDLSGSGSSAHLHLPSSPTSSCHPCLLTPCLTTSLSHFESPLKTVFLLLLVFPPPLLLNSMATL